MQIQRASHTRGETASASRVHREGDDVEKGSAGRASRAQESGSAISRGVVDDDDRVERPRLPCERIKAFEQEDPTVVRHDDGDDPRLTFRTHPRNSSEPDPTVRPRCRTARSRRCGPPSGPAEGTTTYNPRVTSTGDPGFVTPGTSRGLISVLTDYRYLLKRIIRKDMLVRYRGSLLGWVWSYAKPAMQFFVYWLALGVFLGGNARTENYPIYLVSGMILLNFFNEAFANATRSLGDNAPLIQKIYLPREIFPVSSTLIAMVNFLPQLVILLVVCLAVGWHPTVLSVLAVIAAIAIITILSTGLGLFFGAINVSFRDAQNFVDLILMVATWGSPVLYQASALRHAPEWIQVLYNLNPVTPAVELMHYGFWADTLRDPSTVGGFTWYTLIAFLVSVIVLLIGQMIFRRLEGRFAQDL